MSKTNPTLEEVFNTRDCWEPHPTGENLETGAHTNYNPIYFATEHTANVVAEIMQGKVESGNMLVNFGPFTQNIPNRMVRLAPQDGYYDYPNGRLINAGLVADAFNHGQMRINIEAAYREETGRPWFTFKMPWDVEAHSER